MVKTRRQYAAMSENQSATEQSQSNVDNSIDMASPSDTAVPVQSSVNLTDQPPLIQTTTPPPRQTQEPPLEFMMKFENMFKQLVLQQTAIQEQLVSQQNTIQEQLVAQQNAMQASIKQDLNDVKTATQHELQALQKQQDIIAKKLEHFHDIENRLENIEQAQKDLTTYVSQEVSKQVNVQLQNIDAVLQSKITGVQQAVSEEIVRTVDAKISEIASDMTTCTQTIKNLSPTLESVNQDLSAVKMKQLELETKFSNLNSPDASRIQELLTTTEVQLNNKIDGQLTSVIKTVTDKVLEQQQTALQALQDDLINVKTVLGTHVTRDKQDVNRVTDLDDIPTYRTDGDHNLNFNFDQSSGRQRTPIVTSPSNDNYLTSLLLEESMIKYHQFPVFIHESKTVHPVIFLQSFKGVLPPSWSEKRKIRFVIGYIQGEGAIWATHAFQNYNNFYEFEKAFLAKFWSAATQERLRNEASNPQPFHPKNGNLRKYFEKYLNKVKFLDQPLPHEEVLRVLIRNLPTYLRLELAHVPTYDLEQFLSRVDALDIIFEDDRARSNNGYGNSSQLTSNQNRPVVEFNQQNCAPNLRTRALAQAYYPPQNYVGNARQQQQPQQMTSYMRGSDASRNGINCHPYKRNDNRFHPGYHFQNRNNHSDGRNSGFFHQNQQFRYGPNQNTPFSRNGRQSGNLNNNHNNYNHKGNNRNLWQNGGQNNSGLLQPGNNYRGNQNYLNPALSNSNALPIATMVTDSDNQTRWMTNTATVTNTNMTQTNEIPTTTNDNTTVLN